MSLPTLSHEEELLLLTGYERERLAGFHAALGVVTRSRQDVAPAAVTLVAVGCLIAHLKQKKRDLRLH